MNSKAMKFIHKLGLATALLCAGFILSSCLAGGGGPILEERASTPSSAASPEERSRNQAAFQSLCSSMQQYLLRKNYLSLHFTLANPEAFGISEYPIAFEEISHAALHNNMQQLEAFYAEFLLISPDTLSEEEKLSYESVKLFLESNLAVKDLLMHYEPLAGSGGLQVQIPLLLAEYPFRNRQDIENYLTLLASIDEYYAQILEFEKEKHALGLFMSDECASLVLLSLDKFLLSPSGNFMQESFADKLEAFPELSTEEREALTEKHNTLLAEDFSLAYENLRSGLEHLRDSDSKPLHPEAYAAEKKRYAEYLIRISSCHSYDSVDALAADIEATMHADFSEISKLLRSHTGDIVYNYRFSSDSPQNVLEHLKSSAAQSFPLVGQLQYEIKEMPAGLSETGSPALYILPSLDHRQNSIYIDSQRLDSLEILSKLAHEGIPGHMYQWNYFLDKQPPLIRMLLANPAYVEGFAVYAESLSYSMDNAISPQDAAFLSKNFSAQLGLYAFLDLQVNYYAKTQEYVAEYLKTNYNITDESIVQSMYTSLLSNPCHYIKYYVGYLEIIRLKKEAQKHLGAAYSDLDFHTFLLDVGPAPFSAIQIRQKTHLILTK